MVFNLESLKNISYLLQCMSKIKIGTKQITAPPEMIESGLYFREVLYWYRDNFLSPVGASLIYIIFSLLYWVTFGFLIYFIPHMMPLKEKVVIVLEQNRPAGTFISLKSLRKYQEPSYNIIVTLIENYINQRESYTLKKGQSAEDVIRQKKAFIESVGSKAVSASFNEWVSGYNSITGDFLLSDVETNVEIISIELDALKVSFFQRMIRYFIPIGMPNSATVYFISKNNKGREKKFKVNLNFEFKLPKKRGEGELFFKVTSHIVSNV